MSAEEITGGAAATPVSALRVRDDLANLDVTKLSDAELPLLRQMLTEDIDEYRDPRLVLRDQANAEMMRRMKECGARGLLSLTHEVGLEAQWTPWAYNIEALEAAAKMLPDNEAAKVIKHVAEDIIVIPAHLEAGDANSITAIVKRYAGSPVAAAIDAARARSPLDDKLIFKLRPRPKQRNVTPERA